MDWGFLRRRRTWYIAVPIALLIGALAIPYIYVKTIKGDSPPPLSFQDVTTVTDSEVTASTSTDSSLAPSTTTSVATSSAVATSGKPTATTVTTQTTIPAAQLTGRWKVAAGSLAGYRIKEEIVIEPTEGVGRTEKIVGELVMDELTATNASFTVDMPSVKSDEERRDSEYRRIMDVEHYPTSKFSLTQPISLGSLPADQAVTTVQATGNLTLKATTKSVTFPIQARRNGARIEAVGSIPVKFSDYDIDNPSNGMVRTEDHGIIEFVLTFSRA